MVQIVLGGGLYFLSWQINNPKRGLEALSSISLFKDILLRNDVDFDVIEFAPNILVMVFYKRVVVARLSASIMDADSMDVVSSKIIL